MRLFFEGVLVARNEALADDKTGIAIRVALHRTHRAEAERRAWCIAFNGLPLSVANEKGMATMAFSGRVAWIDPAG